MNNILIMIIAILHLSFQVHARPLDATLAEHELNKIIADMNHAADNRQWLKAIKLGQAMLGRFPKSGSFDEERFLTQLKNLNTYYDRAGKLNNAAEYVQLAYERSTSYFGSNHPITQTSRSLYYKYLIGSKKYDMAIGLINESLNACVENTCVRDEADHREHYALFQLISLYGLTEQFDLQATAAEKYIRMDGKLFGEESLKDPDTEWAIEILAKSYCRLKAQDKFQELIASYRLKRICIP